jgi:hypothetical protein
VLSGRSAEWSEVGLTLRRLGGKEGSAYRIELAKSSESRNTSSIQRAVLNLLIISLAFGSGNMCLATARGLLWWFVVFQVALHQVMNLFYQLRACVHALMLMLPARGVVR